MGCGVWGYGVEDECVVVVTCVSVGVDGQLRKQLVQDSHGTGSTMRNDRRVRDDSGRQRNSRMGSRKSVDV